MSSANGSRIVGNYQALTNEALAEFAQGRRLADVVRETIKQELHAI